MPRSRIPMYHPHQRGWRVFVYLATDPTTLPQLPTEVWERVLDELDAFSWDNVERERTFYACCSTCRAWLPRSRYHLFKQVRVQSKEQVKQVSKVLHSNPVFRTRVEKLTVRGSDDAKEDASWVGLVGFNLGPKLKALETITTEHVDLSLTKLDSFQLWGAFNKAWQPGVGRELHFWSCRVTHVNQLVRLAFVTKAGKLKIQGVRLPDERVGPAPPVPVLPRGISLPLSRLEFSPQSLELISTGSWHTLARRCPSLSNVHITSWDRSSLQLPDDRLFLVSIFDMFRCMQRRGNNTNHVTVSSFPSLPNIRMRTIFDGPSNDSTPPTSRPQLRRELVLDKGRGGGSMKRLTHALTCIEDLITPGATNVNGGFHHIELGASSRRVFSPKNCRPLDTILSRLRITAPDVHLVIKQNNQPQNECVLPWARERFPKFCQLLPNAFCDPDGGQPCLSHPSQAGGSEQVQEVEVGEAAESERDEEMGREEASEPEEEIHVTTTTGKRKATEGLEVEEEEARGKRRRAER